MLLLRHEPTKVPVDINPALLSFEQLAIEVSYRRLRLPVARLEDLLVYKMVAGRPQDLRDVEALLVRHVDRADLGHVRRWLRQFQEPLEDPELVDRFERILQRVLRGTEPRLP